MQIALIKRRLSDGTKVFGLLMLLFASINTSASLFSSAQHPLPAAIAFPIDVEQHENRIDIIWNMGDDYYLYQDKLAFTTSNNQPLTNVILPIAKVKQDATFGTTNVYYQQLHINGLLPQSDIPATTLIVQYQGCWDGGVCYAPQTMSFDLAPVASVQGEVAKASSVWSKSSGTNGNWFIQQLEGSNISSLLVIFFLAGLALAFTPCVLPMVPILSSIIVGLKPKPSASKSLALSATYVLAMASTYSLAGLVAGLSGANVQIALQHPLVIGSIAMLFVVFSAAMFGWFNFQMPTGMQLKLNQLKQNQRGGQFINVAIIGSISALVVGPCVAAPLAGALLFIAQSGNPTLGGLALFAMGIGMGLPLLLIGTSAGCLIPKAGAWMQRVNVGFGFLMLYMAIWMTDRVWPEWTLWLIFFVTLVLAVSLLLNSRWQPALVSIQSVIATYAIGIVLGLYAVTLAVGQLAGQATLLQPLQGLIGLQTNIKTSPLSMIKVQSDKVPMLLSNAKANNKPVVLDFYADWCISCKELDAFVFTDPGVQLALNNVELIKVDITANEPAAVNLMRSLRLVGPPALVFYDANGELLLQHTIIGVPDPEDLVSLIEKVKYF